MKYFSCDDPKFIYIHIPKTGGTSLTKILKDKLPDLNISFDGEFVTYNNLTHIKMNQSDFDKYNNYFIFTIVRHPYNWIKSYYNFIHNKHIFYKQISNINIKPKTNLSFDKWLDNLKSFNQCDFFFNNKMLVHKFYKLEEFDSSVKDILKKLNLNDEFDSVQMKSAKSMQADYL